MAESSEPIAIVGVATRFPDEASTTEGLWSFLLKARSAFSPLPSDVIGPGHYHPNPERRGAHAVQGAHFLAEDAALFDAPFFSITRTEVEALDPQQRLLLENVYHALENSGLSLDAVTASDASVYVSGFNHDHLLKLAADPEINLKYRLTGTANCLLSNRISWFFDLKGPSMTLDTACSSSMVALHLACRSLQSGESSFSVVSGVTQVSWPTDLLGMSHQGFLSQKGRSHSFDHRADGYARGEGVGTLIVKRLSDAVRDGDTIRAVIRGSGVNQDGRTPGITLPSSEAQEKLIRRVYASAGLDMKDTNMVEAHGTGTSAGDPLEAAALSRSFSGRPKDSPLIIGALKSGIGHLEGGAGVASVIKSMLVLENAIIPPNVNFEKANPRIPLARYNFHLPLEPMVWPKEGVRRISINSFGVGGTNAHVILDDAYSYLRDHGLDGRHNTRKTLPSSSDLAAAVDAAKGIFEEQCTNGHDTAARPPPVRLMLLSAHDEGGVERNAKVQAPYVSSASFSSTLDRYCHTLNKRSQLQWRSYAVGEDKDTLSSSLENIARPLRVKRTPTLGFVFTGQGAQWYAMGRELMQFPIYEQSLAAADAYFKKLGASWSLLSELQRSQSDTNVREPWLAHPASTALQVALVDLLDDFGIRPSRVVGHSSGEIAAAYCAGKLSRQAAWKVAFFRGVVSSQQTDGVQGGMAAVGLPADSLTPYLDKVNANGNGKVLMACYNSPKNVTVSGDLNKIDALIEDLTADQVFVRKLAVSNAYHSHHMRSVADEYAQLLGELPLPVADTSRAPVEFFSTLTGKLIDPDEPLGAQYWVDNLVSPVQFEQGLLSMVSSTIRKGQATVKLHSTGRALAIDVLLEVGPHSALQSAVRDTIATRSDAKAITSLGLLNRNRASTTEALGVVGQLWTLGCPISISAVNQLPPDQAPPLDTKAPRYSFNHSERIMVESRLSKNFQLRKAPRHDLFGAPVPDWNKEQPRWRNFLSVVEQPWLRDHMITGSIVVPGVAYLIGALEAARQITDTAEAEITGFRFKDVSLKRALVVPDDQSGVETMLSLVRMDESSLWPSATWLKFQVSSWNSVADDWIEHCTGYISVEMATSDNPIDSGLELREAKKQWAASMDQARGGCSVPVDIDSVYDNLATSGINFGPLFRNVSGLSGTPNKAGKIVGSTSVPDVASTMPKKFMHEHIVHPATLDPMLQLFLMSLLDAKGSKTLDSAIVPTFIREAWVSAKMNPRPSTKYVGHADSTLLAFDRYDSNVAVYDSTSGGLRVSFRGIRATPLEATDNSSQGGRRALCHELTWTPHLESLTMDAFLDTPKHSADADAQYACHIASLQTTVVLKVLDALKELDGTASSSFDGHFKRYYEWLVQVRDWYQKDAIAGATKASIDATGASASAKEALYKSVAAASPDGELAVRMGSNIVKVLRKEEDPLRLMFGIDDLLDRVYAEVAHIGDLPQLEREFLSLVGANKSNLRILEIGGGTGSSTVPILEQLASVTADGGLAWSRIEKYTFTDISAAFFEKCRDKFHAYRDILEYKTFDAEKEPVDQGFELGSYDFVVAQNVIHATKDLRHTLSNARKLLKPGGKLLLQEGIRQDFLYSGIAFGQLSGWWAGVESIRPWSPWVSLAQWDEILKDAGYTGVDLDLSDHPNKNLRSQSIMVSTNKIPARAPAPQTIIVTSQPTSSGYSSVVKTLKHHLEERGVGQITVQHFSSFATADLGLSSAVVLCVMELERDPILATLTEAEFDSIRQMVTLCKGMLWVTGDALREPGYAMIEGLCRSNRWERDLEDANLIPLHFSDDAKSQAIMYAKICDIYQAQFLDELPVAEINSDFTVRDGVVLTNRLIRGEGADDYLLSRFSRPAPARTALKDVHRPLRLVTAAPGLLDRLEWVTDDTVGKQPIGATEIELDIRAVGLNFRDVMVSMGEHMATSIGSEASGVITRVGANVKTLSVGDRVAYLSGHADDGAFRTHGRIDELLAVRLPDDLDFETAAGLPCVYVTALYAIEDAARLEAGETILIHAAAGGVGQAAIQLAQGRGAEVFATVSTPAKRDLLMKEYAIPEDHIFYSRDLTFVDGIKRVTEGKGVDVVLNSLSGEALRRSWELLAPFGRFVEIGKRDAQASGRVSLAPFLRHVTMTSVELTTMIQQRPRLVQRLMAEVMRQWREGTIRGAQPTTVLSFGQVEEGFRTMQSGKNTGKIIFVPKPDDLMQVVPPQLPDIHFSEDATYFFSGGLGGIGLSMATWMLARGAKHLVFLSRSGNTDGDIGDSIAAMKSNGADVHIFKCDVSDKSRLAEVVAECKAKLPAIKGVIQGAMVLDDVMFENMSHDSFMKVVKPKVQGSWNLHELLPKQLDFFVMLSSATGVVGNRAQANYAVGNTFQDMLAVHRRSLGLTGSTIDLGTVLAVGYVAKNRQRTQVARNLGMTLETLREDEIHAVLEYCVDPQTKSPAQIVTGMTDVNWYRSRGMPMPTFLNFPLFSNLRNLTASRSDFTEGGQGVLVEVLLNAAQTHEAAAQIIQDAFIEKLASLLSIPAEDIDPGRSISTNGVDSLVAMEFRAFISRAIKADIPVLDIMGTMPLSGVAKKAASISKAVEV